MKSKITTYLFLVLATLIFVACNNDDAAQTPVKYLNISIYSPQPKAATRAHNEVPAEDVENQIHDIHVWAFLTSETGDDATPLGYCTKSGISAASINLQMPILQANLNKLLQSNDGNVDFYVIANTDQLKSLSLTSNLSTATRAQVRDAYFGNNNSTDDFGGSTGTNATTWNVTANGLPSTKMETKTVTVTTTSGETELTKGEIQIQLLRAVSRVRFAFSRATDLTDVEIKSITISSTTSIPKQELLFPTAEETPSFSGTESETWNIQHTSFTSPISECADLANLKKGDTETAEAYEKRIDTAITAGTATEYARTYIRETNAPLTATITYRCEQTILTQTVTLEHTTPTTATNLPRNHTWLIYGYFDKGSLKLTATVQPWDCNEDNIEYKDVPSVTKGLEWDADTYKKYNNDDHELVFITDAAGEETVIVGTFTFDAPRPAVWYASLIHQQGNENAILFETTDEDGNKTYSSTVSGPVGKQATIRVCTKSNKTTVLNRVRLKFSIRRTLNNQNVSVKDDIIGGTYYIRQEKNDF